MHAHRGRARTLMVILALGGGLSLIRYAHGAWWWYAPLAGVGLVLSPVVILLAGNVLLDAGCGTGSLLLAAAQRVAPSGALHGVEASPEMAAHARRKAEIRGIPVQIVEGSAESLPYPPGSFDAAFCTLVLHHLPETMWAAAIREMGRALRPGGRVVLVDWQRPKSLARAIISPMFPVYLLHNLGSKGSPLDVLPLERLLTDLGFEAITRHSFGAGGGVGAVVSRLART
ncbi:MAG TPA: hypothetical protein DEQ28_07265 [Clostridiales bacterium]|nr:hypothetical protein [Clostridiales bacterium]